MPLFSLFSSHRNRALSTAPPVTPPSSSRGITSHRSRSPGHAEHRSGSNLSQSQDSSRSGSPGSNEGQPERRSRDLFGRRRPSPSDRKDILSRDRTLLNTRSKVAEAEAAERSVDAALNASRSAAVEAKDHVTRLEREAFDECGFPRLPEIQIF